MKPSFPDKILTVSGLKTYFYSSRGAARAVDGVSFHLKAGEVLGVVGESGSGKSVTAQSIMRLIPDPPGKIVDGRIDFDGMNLLDLAPHQIRHIRGNRIAMIFQEPMTSLNPVFTIGKNYIYAGMWWLTLFPGATLILLVVAINLFSDWLRDELNPKLARQT